MSESLPAAFLDLPPEAFPFVIRFFDQGGREVYAITVTSIGVIHIPSLAAEHGPVRAQIDWPQGYRPDEGRP